MSEYNAYLAHHGVKGMKWGVRNEETRQRLERGKGRRQKPESDTWKKKESKYLTNEELDRRNARMQKEQQYRQNIDNRHGARKEIKNAAKKILLYSAVGAMSGIMAAQYKEAGKFLMDVGGYAVSNITGSGVPKTAKTLFEAGLKG